MEYTLLRPHDYNSPVEGIYGLSKIHKNNMPMCPIISACGTETYNTAKFITKILNNYCGSKLRRKTFSHIWCQHTSTPVPVALHIINSKISICTNFTNVCKILTEKFFRFLEFTITNFIFSFNKQFYRQLQGASMGSSVSPVIANIYMERFESLAILKSPTLLKW